ncbi:MAG: RNA-guided pseudouridylation complex pseudouridine synthase subunit Cbf5 [Planctomycetota bacterium]
MARNVRKRCATDPAFGCAPAERDLATHLRWGVVALDKPPGLTSRQAAERVAGVLGVAKFGHGGTLDPKVTGVLPVLLGEATRTASLLLGCDKTYGGTMALHGEVPAGRLEEAIGRFRGTITQTPPRRSRVKRRPRRRRIYVFELTERSGRSAGFVVRCQGGTYVRKLVHDLGQELGCGAHMSALRRLRAGPFSADECVTLGELEAAAESREGEREGPLRRMVRSVEDVVGRLLRCVLMDDGAVNSVCSGGPLAVPGICELDDLEVGDRVGAMTLKGELVGLGRALMSSGAILAAERGLAVAVDTVLMEPDTYPRGERRHSGRRDRSGCEPSA